MAVQPADAQVRDNVWNGALIGGAIGAGAGIVLAQIDARLGARVQVNTRYAALVFGGIGAGVGIGIDALLFRNQPRQPREAAAHRDRAGSVAQDDRRHRKEWRW